MIRMLAFAIPLAAVLAGTTGYGALAAGQGPAGRPAMATAEATANLNIVAGPPYSIELSGDAKEVFVSDPNVVSATVRGTRRLLLVGKTPGQAEIFVNDAAGRSLSTYSVVVNRNMDELRETIRAIAPGSSVKAAAIGRQVVLTGEAASPEVVQSIESAARVLLGEDGKYVINQVRLREPEQVMIKVTVAEVRRNVLRQLGIKTSGSWSVGPRSLRFDSADFNNGVSSGTKGTFGSNDANSFVTLSALDRNGALRTLAEPTLTAVSGEAATFRAGGEIPIPGPINCTNNICVRTVEYRTYGVTLGFTPVVISEGRISLRINTVVNEVDPSTAVLISDAVVPGFRTRNLQTTVELPSGGSIMTAGLLQQQNGSTIDSTPGLGSIPVLGVLFRSKEFQRNETELLIVATPYIAKPGKPGAGPLPTDGYVLASDGQQALIGRLSKRYGSDGSAAAPGAGFIAR